MASARARLKWAAIPIVAWCAATSITALAVHAADPRIASKVQAGSLPEQSRFSAGLYVTAQEALGVVRQHANVLLIDVRTHGETVFNGVAVQVHRHIPYVLLDEDHGYDTRSKRYRLVPNPDFVKAVDNLLAERKLNRTATIIVGCSIGERSAKAANLLSQSGFANVYSMVDGFEGDPASKSGRGWKPSGLPWRFEMAPEQAYKSPSF